MLRTITLSLLMLVTVLSMLPFDQSTAHGIRQSSVSQGQRNHYRRHSRAWWRRYRARLRRRRAAALAHRRALLAPKLPQAIAAVGTPATTLTTNLPIGWNGEPTKNSTEMRFRTGTVSGSVPGEAALTVVAQSRPTSGYLTQREERKMLAGTALADLRRIVIDKMITAGGWVINDYQRDMAGYRVFVVTAQTPGDARSPEKSWNFYFTEMNGRIYSLTTNTPLQYSDRMAADAERFIGSLHSGAISSSGASQR
ncbi:MAG: hypothetical protein ND895_09330 [Pyrinomonadaceae bacterium]|nr:hypothetical protein [Pyrinomonadaceae bacterium]